MRTMLPLGVICPISSDATSFYRGLGPLFGLYKSHPEFQLVSNIPEMNWSTVKMLSGVFLQRAFTPQHVQMCKLIKQNNKPLWLDYDDDLLAVPTDNPTWKVYGKEESKKNVIACLGYADVISFSTEVLRLKFVDEFKKNHPEKSEPATYVISNAFDHDLFVYEKKPQRQNFIMWRGSETHVRDLLTYAPEIVALANKYPDWTWLFLGQYPWMMADHVPKGRFIYNDHVDPIAYFHLLKDLRPSIMMCPLHDSEFNRAKSGILWQEGTYAGAVTCVPDWDGWQHPGTTRYSDRKSFYEGMEFLMTASPEFRDAMQAQSWQAVPDVASMNKLRWEIVCRFFRS